MARELLNRDGSPMREYNSPIIEQLLKETEMSNKQNSIEWLVEQLRPAVVLQGKIIDEYLQQAKAMHKEEIKESWEDGKDSFSTRNAEQYYNETFQ